MDDADEVDYGLDDEAWQQLEDEAGELRLPTLYCPVEPNLKQEWFLRREELEVFFGGAAGPGKSWGLLMAALQYVDVPDYHAGIFRPVLNEFLKPKALIPVSHDWLGGTDAHWNGSLNQWTFPSGATVSFGYVRTLTDLSHFKGPAYSFIGFDELTEFEELVYAGMSRVLRGAPVIAAGDTVPLRKRSASNPGGPGHGWVKTRFIDVESRDPAAVFVPATIHDNPHLDYDEYLRSLAHLTPIDQMRLINGDWDVAEEGGKFHREDFIIIDAGQVEPAVKTVRYWDLAATEPSPSNPDPDWTCSILMDLNANGLITIRDLIHVRVNDHRVEELTQETARIDGRSIPIFIERDPGQAGKSQVSHYQRNVLRGYAVHGGLTRMAGKSASKEVRARPVAGAVGNKHVRIVRINHLLEFLAECSIFPNGAHDDFVDVLSGAFNALTGSGTGRGSLSVPKGTISTSALDRERAGGGRTGPLGI